MKKTRKVAAVVSVAAVALFAAWAVLSHGGYVKARLECAMRPCDGAACPVWSVTFGKCYMLDAKDEGWLRRAESKCTVDTWEREREWCGF